MAHRRVMALRRRLLAGALGIAAARAAGAAEALSAPAAPMVAAASDLRWALAEIAGRFEARGGGRVSIVYGSSGAFAQQLAQGAPFQLFLSADERYVETLARAGLTRDAGVLYATGRLALAVPANSPIAVDPDLAGLRARLASVRRFAIAHPGHAPYGRAARESLESARLWDALSPRVVQADSVAAAAQWIDSGSADAGIVAYSLLAASDLGARLRHAPVSPKLHAPLRQRMVLMRGAGAVATDFFEFVRQPAAAEVLRRHGFDAGA